MPLGEHVERALAEGTAARPGIAAPAAELRGLVTKRLADEEDRAAIDCDELYLACACALGDRTALATFATARRVSARRTLPRS